MVEGHSCHRLAFQHRKRLVGRKFVATSPNGRFSDGAASIDGKVLQRIEVHGKNLFYFFEGFLVVHIHFGMSGHFSVHTAAKAPEPKLTTRLRLENSQGDIVAQLSAMTVTLKDETWYGEKIKDLGPDPLREDANKERLWERWVKTTKGVGLVLMDQSMVAGIGNIFRAEILFKAGLHPEQPTKTIPREGFDRVWQHSVSCLQAGFKHGSIRTVDPEEKLGAAWKRRYIYNQASCGRCGSNVKSWLISARQAYCCPTCQPLLTGTKLPERRQDVLATAKGSHLFPSLCARDDPKLAAATPEKLHTRQLRVLLKSRGLDTHGSRSTLLERLSATIGAANQEVDVESTWGTRLRQIRHWNFGKLYSAAPGSTERERPQPVSPVEKKKRQKKNNSEPPSGINSVRPDTLVEKRPGTSHLFSEIADPADAAREKIAAGEKRSVEHVAEMDDAVASALEEEQHMLPKRRRNGSKTMGIKAFPTPLNGARKMRKPAMSSSSQAQTIACFHRLRRLSEAIPPEPTSL
jgi:formamidopyrimidine-DNA glycosylase